MDFIKLIEVRSELGAGTRGASLGVDALKTACLDKGSDYFIRFDISEVETENDALFEPTPYSHAKHIDSVYKVERRTSDAVRDAIEDGYFPLVQLGGCFRDVAYGDIHDREDENLDIGESSVKHERFLQALLQASDQRVWCTIFEQMSHKGRKNGYCYHYERQRFPCMHCILGLQAL